MQLRPLRRLSMNKRYLIGICIIMLISFVCAAQQEGVKNDVMRVDRDKYQKELQTQTEEERQAARHQMEQAYEAIRLKEERQQEEERANAERKRQEALHRQEQEKIAKQKQEREKVDQAKRQQIIKRIPERQQPSKTVESRSAKKPVFQGTRTHISQGVNRLKDTRGYKALKNTGSTILQKLKNVKK